MDIIFLLIPVAMVLVILMAAVYWWTVKTGQMDDLEGPAYRILMDDDGVKKAPESESKSNEKSDL